MCGIRQREFSAYNSCVICIQCVIQEKFYIVLFLSQIVHCVSLHLCGILIGYFIHFCLSGDVTIPGGINFTVDSDINGDDSQFTLTCTSTGGPATTVTWTRDSQTVQGGMTVLNNTVAAQYTHTLTVTGRLGGQYQCNVTNYKPSQATANITVQGNGL